MNGEKPWTDPELLEELYWTHRNNSTVIAKRFGVSGTTIRYMLRKYDIPTRKEELTEERCQEKINYLYLRPKHGLETHS
jgi:hypothetical protein